MNGTPFERFLLLMMAVCQAIVMGLCLRCKFLEADRDYWQTKAQYLEQR